VAFAATIDKVQATANRTHAGLNFIGSHLPKKRLDLGFARTGATHYAAAITILYQALCRMSDPDNQPAGLFETLVFFCQDYFPDRTFRRATLLTAGISLRHQTLPRISLFEIR
jgi:hypothetical protein